MASAKSGVNPSGSAAFISSHTKTLAIIGDPIEHSITPRIQNAAWQALRDSGAAAGVLCDVVNVAFRVPAHELERAVRVAKALGLRGLMVTIPHKEKVLALCDELHQSAQLMGAANLLHFQSDGKIVGHSSDGWAAIESLKEEGVEVPAARIAILGGGGAARSLALAFAHAGAREVLLLNRTVERAQIIADEVRNLKVKTRACALDESTLREVLGEVDLLVNATSVGMHPREEECPVPDGVLHPHLAVYDIVYNPLETALLKMARACGARAVDGLGMLIYTNVYAAKVCAGSTLSPVVMREAALRALSA
jgi:shikimate dehydrogenase